MKRSWMRLALLGALCLFGAAEAIHAAPPPPAAPRADHKHEWRTTSKKVWVPPVYQKKLVGYDKDGKPIYQDVLVRKGYYKTVTVQTCVKGGATR